MDDCKTISCPVCQIMDCPVRKQPFVKKVKWTAENVTRIEKHTVEWFLIESNLVNFSATSAFCNKTVAQSKVKSKAELQTFSCKKRIDILFQIGYKYSKDR